MHVCCVEPGDSRGKDPYRYLLTGSLSERCQHPLPLPHTAGRHLQPAVVPKTLTKRCKRTANGSHPGKAGKRQQARLPCPQYSR